LPRAAAESGWLTILDEQNRRVDVVGRDVGFVGEVAASRS
jgi:hypothetical protein